MNHDAVFDAKDATCISMLCGPNQTQLTKNQANNVGPIPGPHPSLIIN